MPWTKEASSVAARVCVMLIWQRREPPFHPAGGGRDHLLFDRPAESRETGRGGDACVFSDVSSRRQTPAFLRSRITSSPSRTLVFVLLVINVFQYKRPPKLGGRGPG